VAKTGGIIFASKDPRAVANSRGERADEPLLSLKFVSSFDFFYRASAHCRAI